MLRVSPDRRLLLLLGALSTFGPLSVDMYLPGLPAMGADLSAPASAAQLTLTTCLLGLGLGQLVAGPLSDRLGRRAPLLAGLLAYAVMSAVCAVSPTVWVLVAARFIQGLAGSFGLVIARAVVRDRHEGREMARQIALIVALGGVAPIVAPLLGGALLHVTDWRGVFLVLAGLGLVLLLATWRVLSESLPADRRHAGTLGSTFRSFGPLLRDRHVVGAVLAGSLTFGALAAYIAGSPFVLQNVFGVSPQTFSLLFSMNAVGIMSASTLSSRIVDRVGARPLLLAGVAGATTGAAALVVVVWAHTGIVGVLIPLFVIASSVGLTIPNAAALAMAGHPRSAGAVSGLLGSTQFAIAAVAAPLAGLGGRPARTMAIVMAAFAVSGALASRLVRRGASGAGTPPSSPEAARPPAVPAP